MLNLVRMKARRSDPSNDLCPQPINVSLRNFDCDLLRPWTIPALAEARIDSFVWNFIAMKNAFEGPLPFSLSDSPILLVLCIPWVKCSNHSSIHALRLLPSGIYAEGKQLAQIFFHPSIFIIAWFASWDLPLLKILRRRIGIPTHGEDVIPVPLRHVL